MDDDALCRDRHENHAQLPSRRDNSGVPAIGSKGDVIRRRLGTDLGPLYRQANYLELYILGAVGTGRSQLQVLIAYDPCCFDGVDFRTYEPTIREIVARLGGRFEVFLDTTHREHKTRVSRNRMMNDFAR